jgi:PKD repeat protein
MLIFGSCKEEKKPISSFVIEPAMVYTGMSFTAKNMSVNADMFEWTDNIGMYVVSTDLVYKYNDAGKYEITLKASGNGSSDTYSKILEVLNPSLQ